MIALGVSWCKYILNLSTFLPPSYVVETEAQPSKASENNHIVFLRHWRCPRLQVELNQHY